MRSVLVLACLAVVGIAYQQQNQNQARSLQFEKAGLAEAFKGITTNGTPETGLFSIKSTGVSTAPVVRAATAFLASLNPDQRAKSTFSVTDDEWRKWMNQHFYVRQGVSFLEMSPTQRDAAMSLLASSLSARGLRLSQDIMKLNHTLGELNNNNFEDYGEGRYHITVMGTPSTKEPWGWQIDGHHLIVNYFVLGDQVVMSPFFVGSEPVIAHEGKYKGTTILQQEQNDGVNFMLSLNEDQRKQATLNASKTGNNNLSEAWKDNIILDYAGLRVSTLDSAHQKQLLKLVELYVGNMDDGHAKIRMEEVRKHLDKTFFAWIGPADKDGVFYYRVHSPVLLLEFDHQNPAGLRNLPRTPNREHIHAVLRTPNGNDYGKDLLRMHYAQHAH